MSQGRQDLGLCDDRQTHGTGETTSTMSPLLAMDLLLRIPIEY